MDASFSGSFTFECWVYLTSYSGGTLFTVGSEKSGRYYFWQSNNGQPGFNIYGGANYNIGSAGSIPLNQWTHVAFVNQGTSNMYCYVNGVSLGSVAYTGGTVGNNGGVTIGARPGGGSGSVGYISNFRMVNSAVYTSNFTPSTTPLTAITNTSLLTCQSSTSATTDASTNAYTITNNGSATATGLSPFAYPAVAAVAPVVAVAGQPSGSTQFNGSSQYLTFSGLTIGTNAYTVEFWFYANNFTNPYGILHTNNTNALGIRLSNSTTIAIDQQGVVTPTFTVPTMSTNTWYHVVVVRNSSNQTTVFVNGVRSSTGAVTMTTNYNAVTNLIGNLNSTYYFPGYISNLRVVNGTALYDPTQTTFTPPVQPLPVVTNTALLTCQSQTSSTTDATGLNTITNNGTTIAVTASPFHN
jgi:hypothetical protein